MEEEKHLLNKEQLAELRQAFIECDKNNDNFITTGELGWTMRVMGFNPTEVELQQLLNKESVTMGAWGPWNLCYKYIIKILVRHRRLWKNRVCRGRGTK